MKFPRNAFIILPLLVFLVILSNLGYSTQNNGRPYIRHYSPEETSGENQNWAVAQDLNGNLFFGNKLGVLIFNGFHWKLKKIENQSVVRSLHFDSISNRIFVGGQGEFGFLKEESSGNFQYTNLSETLPNDERAFKDVAKIHKIGEYIFFQALTHLFRWDGISFEIWKPEKRFHLSFKVGEDLWIKENGIGLLVLKGDSLTLPSGAEFFADDRVYGFIKKNDDSFLIAARGMGLFNASYSSSNNSLSLDRLPSYINDSIVKKGIYGAVLLKEGKALINTVRGGVALLGFDPISLELLDKAHGLPEDNIKSAFEDLDGSIWLATNSGITRVDINDPFKLFTEVEGVNGKVYSINKLKDSLIIGTSQGLLVYDEGRFKNLYRNLGSIWDLQSIGQKSNQSLLAATNSGIYDLYDKSLAPIIEDYVFDVYKSKYRENRVFASNKILDRVNGKWKLSYTFEGLEGDFLDIKEDCNKNLWFSTRSHGIYMIGAFEYTPTAYRIHHFDTTKGLPNLYNPRIFKWGCKLLVYSDEGIYSFNPKYDLMEYDSSLNESLIQESGDEIRMIKTDLFGALWAQVVNIELGTQKILRIHDSEDKFEIEKLKGLWKAPLLTLENFFQEDSIFWIPCYSGLVRYDYANDKILIPRKNFESEIDFLPIDVEYESSILNDLTSGMDIFSLYDLYPRKDFNYTEDGEGNSALELPYKFNTILFSFNAVYFKGHDQMVFRYKLKGKNNSWSSWKTECNQTFFNLKEGQYEFQIQAQSVFGEKSKISSLSFIVLPPWYRTWLAYVGYVLTFFISLFGAARAYAWRLRNQKRRLEQQVQIRTQEIRKQRDQIEKKNTELEHQKEEITAQAENLKNANDAIAESNALIERKNRDITDSIQYAKYIQEAMLPQLESIKKSLPQSFVFFQPKDIVSGDFFWHGEVDNYLVIAAVDCTGHGVPGAFMSMLGSTIIHQIVYEHRVFSPDKILDELNDGIRDSLKQQDSQNRDGMDAALCVYNKETKVLEFAGAKNPLVHVNEDGLQTIKGDKFPIGGYQMEGEYKFTCHSIKIEKPTSIYLFSDGYQDQFGGPRGKKYMVKRLRERFQENWNKPFSSQWLFFDKEFSDWKGSNEQMDDILLIGFQLK